ncbi:MAG TPA: DUF1801 domain-containing protein [Gemmatimonadales bacterium]|nr:DUF1801 domain-containing protein [Gemmatimonadales bacterium]
MPKKSSAPAHRTPADTTVAVDAFMASLEHPHKDAIALLRRLVAGVDPSVAEGIKWNAPSWRTTEYFATTNLRSKAGVGLILHLGAKARALPPGGLAIDDPGGLLRWLANDRAMAEFAGRAELARRGDELVHVLRQWIAHV